MPSLIVIGDNESEDNKVEVARYVFEKKGYDNYVIVRVRRYPELGKLNINVVYSLLLKLVFMMGKFDYISLIEADVILDREYFARVIRYFQDDPKLCVAGGRLEPLGHLRDSFPFPTSRVLLWGSNRVYRAACLRKINELIDILYLPAWDTNHSILVLYLGYKIRQVDDAVSITLREVNPNRGVGKGAHRRATPIPVMVDPLQILGVRARFRILNRLYSGRLYWRYGIYSTPVYRQIISVYRYAIHHSIVRITSKSLRKLLKYH